VSVPQGTPLTQNDWAKITPGSYIPRPDNWRIGKVMPTLVRRKNVFEGYEKSRLRKEAALKKAQLGGKKGGKKGAKKGKVKVKARK
jgi:large subunit ribosomal protein L27